MSIEINKKFVSLQMSFFFLVQARFLYECDGCGKAVGGCDGGGGAHFAKKEGRYSHALT